MSKVKPPPYPTISFTGGKLSGALLSCPSPPPQLQVWRTQFAGVQGESEIVGMTGGRDLEFQVLLFGGFSERDDLNDYITKTLDANIGQNGPLSADGSRDSGWSLSWDNCTFEGFTRTSQDLLDIAQTIDGGWYVFGVLKFRHLGPKKQQS
jgi:hypothetical protein